MTADGGRAGEIQQDEQQIGEGAGLAVEAVGHDAEHALHRRGRVFLRDRR